MKRREFKAPPSTTLAPTERGGLGADTCDQLIDITAWSHTGMVGLSVLVSCAEWCALCEHVEGLEPMRAYRASEQAA